MFRLPRCCWVLALPLVGLPVLLAGCAGTRPEGTAGDAAMVTLGRYTFGPQSNQVNHPWLVANPNTPAVKLRGWGTQKGMSVRMVLRDGGKIAGVKTLRVNQVDPGGSDSKWFAQDTQGNIHFLADGTGSPRGVAGQQSAWFLLLRGPKLTPGATWTLTWNGRKVGRYRVMSTSATFRGKAGLLCVREILDANDDERFDPAWGGRDWRTDLYFQRGAMLYGLQVSAKGGFCR